MAFLENFLVPVVQAIITLGILALIGVGFYFLMFKTFRNFTMNWIFWFKYKIFRKPYNEAMIGWVMDIINSGKNINDFERDFYITNKFNLGDFEEAKYIYNQLKGGIK